MLSSTTYNIVDASDATYTFTFDWVRVSHITATINGVAVPAADIAITGTSGAATLTLSGTTLSSLALNDVLVILKTTPTAFSARTVIFTDEGAVSLAALDDAFLHDISLIQDAIDAATNSLVIDSSWDGDFNAQGLQIQNLGEGLTANSAVTLAQLQAVTTASGALPAVTAAFNGYFLTVQSGSWATASSDVAGSALGLGTAASRTVEVDGSGLYDGSMLDANFLQRGANLSDLTDVGTAQVNLALGSAALQDTGTDPNDVVALDGSGNIPAGVGLDSGVDFSGTSVYHKDGGVRDAVQIVEMVEGSLVNVDNDGVVVSDDFETDATNNVPLVDAGSGAPSYELNNTAPVEVSVNATTDVFNLTAGTWEIDMYVSLSNQHVVSGQDRLGLSLYDTSGAALIKKLNNTYTVIKGHEDSGAGPATFRLRVIYTFAGGAKAIAVRIAGDTASEIRIINGSIRCARVK